MSEVKKITEAEFDEWTMHIGAGERIWNQINTLQEAMEAKDREIARLTAICTAAGISTTTEEV